LINQSAPCIAHAQLLLPPPSPIHNQLSKPGVDTLMVAPMPMPATNPLAIQPALKLKLEAG